jgi:hypothetical protein
MSLESPDSDARSSRITLEDGLVGKLVFDDPQVFKRLALDRVSPQFVANCAQSFTTDQDLLDQDLLDARRELDTITAAAIVEELEADDEVHDFFGIRKNVEDKEMCKPLVRYRSSQSRGFFTIIRNRGPYFNTWKIFRIRPTLYQNILSSLRTRQF